MLTIAATTSTALAVKTKKSLFTSKYMALVTTISKSNTLTSVTVGLTG